MDRIAGSGLLSVSCTGVGEGGDVMRMIDGSERDERPVFENALVKDDEGFEEVEADDGLEASDDDDGMFFFTASTAAAPTADAFALSDLALAVMELVFMLKSRLAPETDVGEQL